MTQQVFTVRRGAPVGVAPARGLLLLCLCLLQHRVDSDLDCAVELHVAQQQAGQTAAQLIGPCTADQKCDIARAFDLFNFLSKRGVWFQVSGDAMGPEQWVDVRCRACRSAKCRAVNFEQAQCKSKVPPRSVVCMYISSGRHKLKKGLMLQPSRLLLVAKGSNVTTTTITTEYNELYPREYLAYRVAQDKCAASEADADHCIKTYMRETPLKSLLLPFPQKGFQFIRLLSVSGVNVQFNSVNFEGGLLGTSTSMGGLYGDTSMQRVWDLSAVYKAGIDVSVQQYLARGGSSSSGSGSGRRGLGSGGSGSSGSGSGSSGSVHSDDVGGGAVLATNGAKLSFVNCKFKENIAVLGGAIQVLASACLDLTCFLRCRMTALSR